MRLNAAHAHLARDPVLAPLIARHGAIRRTVSRRSPYEALVRAIAHQQLHARAAEAILARFLKLFPDDAFPAPHLVLAADDAVLCGTGFSAGKIAAIRDIATHALAGTVPTRARAARFTDEALIERLVVIRGVGRWTVEMLLMGCLGRPDVLPVDDWGIREGFRVAAGLAAQPAPRALRTIGEGWAPFRTTASWHLWRAADAAKLNRPRAVPAPAADPESAA